MAPNSNRFRVLVLDDDDALAFDAAGFEHPRADIALLDPGLPAPAVIALARAAHAVVVSIRDDSSMALLAEVARAPDAPPVIALAGRGLGGHTLEHTLLLAELRGAKLALPKPIDAAEFVLASLALASLADGAIEGGPGLAADLERRLGW